MKILIVGAGVVGSIYGWALAACGHQVTHLVRTGRSANYASGLNLDIVDKRQGQKPRYRGMYALKTVEDLSASGEYGLVIVPGHHYALGEVLSDIIPRLPGSDVLFLTQNWAGTAEIDAVLPRSRYVLGDAKAGGSWKNGTLVGGLHSLDIGPAGPEGDDLAQRISELFSGASVPCPVLPDMVTLLWVQFAQMGGLWPALVEAESFDRLLNDRKAVERALGTVRECLGLLEKRGVDLDKYPETGLYRSGSWVSVRIVTAMLRWTFRHSEFMKRVSSHALDDPAEIRAFYRDIGETARELGHPMPLYAGYRDAIETLCPRFPVPPVRP